MHYSFLGCFLHAWEQMSGWRQLEAPRGLPLLLQILMAVTLPSHRLRTGPLVCVPFFSSTLGAPRFCNNDSCLTEGPLCSSLTPL